MNRVSEKQLNNLVLYLLLTSGPLTTSQLIDQVTHYLEQHGLLSSGDERILAGRNDTTLSQIIRNIVSHRALSGNMVHDGLLSYDRASSSLAITLNGKEAFEDFIATSFR